MIRTSRGLSSMLHLTLLTAALSTIAGKGTVGLSRRARARTEQYGTYVIFALHARSRQDRQPGRLSFALCPASRRTRPSGTTRTIGQQPETNGRRPGAIHGPSGARPCCRDSNHFSPRHVFWRSHPATAAGLSFSSRCPSDTSPWTSLPTALTPAGAGLPTRQMQSFISTEALISAWWRTALSISLSAST